MKNNNLTRNEPASFFETMEYIDELELLRDAEAIAKGSWLEHFKHAKDVNEMYGGHHWRSIKANNAANICREAMEKAHNERLKFEGKHE